MRMRLIVGLTIVFLLTTAGLCRADDAPSPVPSTSSTPLKDWPAGISTPDFYCQDANIGDTRRRLLTLIEATDYGLLFATAQAYGEAMAQCLLKYDHPAYAVYKLDGYAILGWAGLHRDGGPNPDEILALRIAISAARIANSYSMPAGFHKIYDDSLKIIDLVSRAR